MNASERQRIYVEGLKATIHLLEQSVATQKSELGRRAASIATLEEQQRSLILRTHSMDAEIARLRAALTPFAKFAKEYGPVASALDYPEDHILLQVGTAPEAVVVRLSDFYAAVEALGEDGA